MVVIKTKEFILRPIRLSDAQGYLECHQDNDARKNFSSVPKTLAEAKKDLKKYKNVFAVEVNKEFAGFISLRLNKNPTYKHSAVIGYGIHKKFRRKGLATKVVKKITEYGFKKLKLKRISGYTRAFNKASQKVLKKSGYKLEGLLRKNKYIHGKYLDDMIWAKVR